MLAHNNLVIIFYVESCRIRHMPRMMYVRVVQLMVFCAAGSKLTLDVIMFVIYFIYLLRRFISGNVDVKCVLNVYVYLEQLLH